MKRIASIFLFVLAFVAASSAGVVATEPREDVEKAYQEEFIRQFVDAYRQAYDSRNISFISKLFGEKSLIITQTMDLVEGKDTYKDRGKRYRVVVEKKRDYIKRLKKIFDSATYLRLEISSIRIEEHFKFPGLYGVTFTQTWEGDGKEAFSGELHHRGYALLIIDFSQDRFAPTIHIRTWQPEKVLEAERKFNLYDFEVL